MFLAEEVEFIKRRKMHRHINILRNVAESAVTEDVSSRRIAIFPTRMYCFKKTGFDPGIVEVVYTVNMVPKCGRSVLMTDEEPKI